jgi:ribosomal-protein-alanine N-acetyltransferase
VALGHEGLSVGVSDGPSGAGPAGGGGLRLERIPVATARALVRGSLARPAAWHPEFPADGTLNAARMLLGTYAALELDPERTPWWFFAMVVDGVVVGDAGYHGPPPADGPVEVEIGYQVVPAFRRRGLASRACALLLEHAWRNGAEVVRAEVEPDNPDGAASRAVLRANGFRPTAQGDFVVEAPVSAPA